MKQKATIASVQAEILGLSATTKETESKLLECDSYTEIRFLKRDLEKLKKKMTVLVNRKDRLAQMEFNFGGKSGKK
jgi:hypothetical protein